MKRFILSAQKLAKTINVNAVLLLAFFFFSAIGFSFAQKVSNRSNSFEVDMSDPKKMVNSTVPLITWVTPESEISYVQDKKFKLRLEVSTSTPIKNIIIKVKEDEGAAARGEQAVKIEESTGTITVDKTLTLIEGNNYVEVIVENIDGVKSITGRKVIVGATSIANVASLDRTDYAILFATDKYDHWGNLVNPIFDTKAIAEELKKTYGFKVIILENPSQQQMFKQLREFAEKKFKPLDQLFIFFAGHGTYDQTFGEGYVVTKESLLNDEAKTTYLSYNRLRSIVNNIPCEHIFLAMDVCFGGTFDQALASSRGFDAEAMYKEQSSTEYISKKLTYKTRKFLTSGGKQYVSDGIPGKHSPFARGFIEALRSRGGSDGILTLTELFGYVEKLKITPRFGEFGDNAPGSDFLFISR